jgi:hypothetical protein
MENPENQQMSPEELLKKKAEMLAFYKESSKYLQAQLQYEKLLAELDEVRVKRIKLQHEFAYLSMTPEQEEELRQQMEKAEENTQHKSSKERKLKTD